MYNRVETELAPQAEYQRAFIESRLWRNASRAKEQHGADNIALVAKGMLLLIVA